MKLIFILLVIILLFCGIILSAQSKIELEIDLANLRENPKSVKKIELDGSAFITLIVKNLIPSKKYRITAGKNSAFIPSQKFKINKDAKGCAETWEAAKFNLMYEERESGIQSAKEAFYKNLENNCFDEIEKFKYRDSMSILTEFTAFPEGISVRAGDELVITIKREGNGGMDKDFTWTTSYSFIKPEQSSDYISGWSISFGFAFPFLFAMDETFFAKQIDTLDYLFVIKEKNNNDVMRFIPAIFISWLPKQDKSTIWAHSLTGGFGFDLQDPSVFLGGSIIYNRILSLNYGIAVHKVFRLRGEYKKGDIVRENLEFDQLHEKVYRYNFFLGLSFRFSSDPFN